MHVRLVAVQVALLSVPLLWPSPARAWDQRSHERVISYAIRLMPPVLQNQLIKHKDELLAGVNEPDHMTAPASHSLNLDGSGGVLDAAIERELAAAAEHVRTHGSFDELARAFGRISHFAADATFPLNSSDSDPREAQYYADYTAYAASKLTRYPPIFDGYGPVTSPGFRPSSYVRGLAENANRSYPIVSRGYFPDKGSMRSSKTFDDRGPVFGVTQLAFIHAVSATANLWLHAWREAHGNLAGTPHYPSATRPASAKNYSSAAQRP